MSNESEAQHASSWAHDTHPEAHQHDANIEERAPSIHDVFNIWELYCVNFPNVIIDEQLLERIQLTVISTVFAPVVSRGTLVGTRVHDG